MEREYESDILHARSKHAETDEEEEMFLSEIHIRPENGMVDGRYIISNFYITVPSQYIKSGYNLPTSISIRHAMGSSLSQVGTQVWSGALLLADFLLSVPEVIRNEYVVELGAGTGLSGLCAALCGAKTVFCTDNENRILENCRWNAEYVRSDVKKLCKNVGSIKVRYLDWLDKNNPLLRGEDPVKKSLFSWTQENLQEVAKAKVILAADVIYDDVLTDAFIYFITQLLSLRQDRVLYISMEKRINFSLDQLKEVAEAYEHFFNALQNSDLKAEQINIDFPKWFDYIRTKELELWKISLKG
ncbi:uncharacterized protein VTP21DRAFT_4351 [Calcarisporiella thermophila]|uniref:uncharacterized protein n=1 Tax=Calcarisporiella thermophila TaxID=911321 RepID=UPI0037444410